MINKEIGVTGYILNILTIVQCCFACIISSIVFILIMKCLYKEHLKRETRITLILCANIYLLILVYASILISFSIDTLLSDLYGQISNSSFCIFRGYFVFVVICSLYYTFVNQVSVIHEEISY